MLLIVIIILCIGIIITKCYYRLDVYGYATPVVICLASALFLLFKSLNMNWNIANKLAPYCLGIYLMHPVFINFVYKFCLHQRIKTKNKSHYYTEEIEDAMWHPLIPYTF
ncbi:acyltransferase family protein [Phocaeicola sp. RTP21359st1_F7_RTP21360_211022]